MKTTIDQPTQSNASPPADPTLGHTPLPWTYLSRRTLHHVESSIDAPVAGEPVCSIPLKREADAALIVRNVNGYASALALLRELSDAEEAHEAAFDPESSPVCATLEKVQADERLSAAWSNARSMLSGMPPAKSSAPAKDARSDVPVYSWQFDPLAPEMVEITCNGVAFMQTPTLTNAQRVCDTLNSHARLTAQNAALVAALEWIDGTAENLHCALQSTAHMDPNDSRVPVITGQAVRDLIVLRDSARAALAQARTP